MWSKQYRDYPENTPLKKEQVEPSSGIIGCEMHEVNGWGTRYLEPPKPQKKGLISAIITTLFG